MPARPPAEALAAAAAALLVVAAIGGLALTTAAPDRVPDEQSQRDPASGLDSLHAAGVTGENVTVGVLDVTGFDPSHEALGGRVADAAAFGEGATVRNGGQNTHGTAAAAVVARTAPDADLYLASFRGEDGYERAVEWLVASDADVIVAPVSFYGKPGNGSATVSRAATHAVLNGTVFVAAAGNVARGHWHGRYDEVENGTLQFESGPRNYLSGGDRATVWLSWDDPDEDYTAELYRRDGETARLIARSQPYPSDDAPNERIRARLTDGAYFLAVRGPDNATGTRLELASPTHEFQHVRANRSVVAPGTARGVVTVGAYDREADRLAPYSGRGPTRDGRLGVNVVAPADPSGVDAPGFRGSSAAAPYAGGVAALALSADSSQSPLDVERALEQSAIDVGRPGADPRTGYGRVDPVGAVGAANNGTASD